MSDIPQRYGWSGEPFRYGEPFRLQKDIGERSRVAVCDLWSHQFGWEIRLLVDGELLRSQVCRTDKDWLETHQAWKTALLAVGWA